MAFSAGKRKHSCMQDGLQQSHFYEELNESTNLCSPTSSELLNAAKARKVQDNQTIIKQAELESPKGIEHTLLEGLEEGDQIVTKNAELEAPQQTKCKNALWHLLEENKIRTPHFNYPAPLAWADSRPDLCAALPYFKSHQGGTYHHEKLIFSLLLDGHGMKHDLVDDQVIISRTGGSCIGEDGFMVPNESQSIVKGPPSWYQNTIDHNMVVIPIIGNRHPAIQYHPKAKRYNVMDHFRVTDIWPESWWLPKTPSIIDTSVQPAVKTCGTCNKTSKQIFTIEWLCLNEACTKFWKNSDDKYAAEDLEYNPDFLKARVDPKKRPFIPCAILPDPDQNVIWAPQMPPSALRALRITQGSARKFRNETKGYYVSESEISGPRKELNCWNWKGFVCPRCGRCNPRSLWDSLKCSEECGFHVELQLERIRLQDILRATRRSESSIKLKLNLEPRLRWYDGPGKQGFQYSKWVLDNIGSVTHIRSNSEINKRPHGPDELFSRFQQGELKLQRLPLVSSVVRGELTRHFAANFGLPYKFIARVNTTPFSEAPACVLHAVARLNEIGRCLRVHEGTEKACGTVPEKPNECLILGYMETMQIGYHDDGEKELGDEIRTLSLGSGARMNIRLKAKYYFGYTPSGTIIPDDPIVPPGCEHEQERRQLKAMYPEGMASEAYRKAREKLHGFSQEPQDEKTLPPGRGARKPPVLFSMFLNHGDSVIMHEKALQKYCEHQVVPVGRLRFAVTTRHVIPDMLAPGERAGQDFDVESHIREFHEDSANISGLDKRS
ncbi:hypothetical protein N7470_006252 [Penicillium chermesinum]|nr:hypothetical protein N7470_006252 [Penicillium chermesinum]